MRKISVEYLNDLLKDERGASKEYKKLASRGMTKGEKQKFKSMSKDEARHAKYIEEMLSRRK